MIKQIKSINNIGSFREFSNGGSIQFEKLTFIYGLNTRGKSTLTDILTSLKENDPSLITTRKSIPLVSLGQSVKISVKPVEATNQLNCIFSNSSWTEVHSHEHLHIFGSDFIYKNLFTGLTIERQNKENFTRFILGQEGVELASQIAEDKRVLRQKKGSIQNLLPSYLKDKEEHEFLPFLTTDPDLIEIEVLREKLPALEQKLIQEKQRLQKPAEILAIEDVQEFNIPNNNLLDLTINTNDLLNRQFNEISTAALTRLKHHIESNFEKTNNAEQWIKEGLDTRKIDSRNCSFCGQILEQTNDLINVYHVYFNEEYRNYISDLSISMGVVNKQWRLLKHNALNALSVERPLISQYSQLINSDSFTTSVEQLFELITLTQEEELNDLIDVFFDQVKLAFYNKERKPHEIVQKIDFSSLLTSFNTYQENLTAISETLNAIREAIHAFKEQYRDLTLLGTKIADLTSEIEVVKKGIARVEQNDACVTYQNEQQEIIVIEGRITTNEQALSENQNQYLDRFYTRIDFHFKQFGSNNFTLERGIDNRGHQPVYFLKVKFKDVEINDSNITKVFSESDKRALSLSLFWAKMDFLTPEQKQNSIIVLDDPVTSFDDNRILKSISRIKDTLREMSQVIVLTHYSHFIRNFIERGMNDDFTISFIEIAQDNTTSFLRRIDSNVFTETTYDRVFSRIQSFINRESEVDIRADLRPFLESLYLPHFYIKEYKSFTENNTPFGTLNEKIDAIFLDETVKAKFHEFRTMLNPDSHLFTSSNEEDTRNFAREMMEYLYNFSHNK